MKKTHKSKSGLLTQPFKFQPGLVLGVLGLAFLGGGVLLSASATNSTSTLACKPVAVTNLATSTPTDSQVMYTAKSTGQGGMATASVKAGAKCVGPMISLVTYTTTSASGTPLKSQRIFDSQTKALAAATVDFSVKIPDCYYQIDLVYGQPLDLSTGQNYHASSNFLWGVVGGTKACAAPATPTPKPSTSATPKPSSTPKPSVLPTATSTPSPTPTEESTPTPKPSPTATPGSGGSTPTPSPTPTVIPLGPGETTPPTVTQTNVLPFLPQTGQPGSFMSFLGALLVTAGLFHIYLSQRRKLLKTSKAR